MLTGQLFKLMKRRGPARENDRHDCGQAYLTKICHQIVRDFERITSLAVVSASIDLDALEEGEAPVDGFCHDACSDFQGTGYCRESWQLHLVQLKKLPETHWHRCDYGRFCAVVPFVVEGCCVAAFRLACLEKSMTMEEFEVKVELLDLLVQHAISGESGVLRRLCSHSSHGSKDGCPTPSGQDAVRRTPQGPLHPQVQRALEHIEHELSNPELTVARTAAKLEMHCDYLAHLFAEQVGQRMSRYISVRRIERAKNLLITSNWRIARIARESGFANPKWFNHVFKTLTGVTPSAYRNRSRAGARQEIAAS
jgi:AraC-like DNA-binding protein